MSILNGDFFPQGIASGDNFCNRVIERDQLQANVKSCRPTLIISPRRYGKTSLVLFVLSSMGLPFAHIDLYSDLNEEEMQNSIMNAIGDILFSVEKGTQKALNVVMDFFADFNVSFKIGGERIQIEFTRSKKSPAKVILDALEKLDKTLKSKNKKSVIFIDEFQRVSKITNSHAIEAALRSVAQESKNIMFIFSGSNRDILSNLFDDHSKPLYKLCDRITLDRIEDKDYIPFIENKFKRIWGSSVKEDVIEEILGLTERHPYYVNVLCFKVSLNEKMPNLNDVSEAWHKYALSEKTNITAEIDKLSSNQSKLLISMAKYGDDFALMGKEFNALTGFSASSAAQSLKALEKMDYIQAHGENRYKIVDPLIKYIYTSRT